MRINRRIILYVATFTLMAATVFGAGPAQQKAAATTVMKLNTDGLAKMSQWVVRARVVDVAYVDLRSQGKGLFTDVRLVIDETLRGEKSPPTLTMRLVGGVATDGVAVTVPGMPRFTVGEDIVVFLEKTSMGHVPAGLGQGVWRVMLNPVGPALVQQSTHDLNIVERGPNGKLTNVEGHGLVTKTLLQLVTQIRSVR